VLDAALTLAQPSLATTVRTWPRHHAAWAVDVRGS